MIGTLCAWDTEPRGLTDEQTARLEDLAEQAAARIELTRWRSRWAKPRLTIR